MKRIFAVAVFAFSILIFSFPVHAEETLNVFFPISKSFAGSTFEKMLNNVINTVGQAAGIKFKITTYYYGAGENTTEMTMKALKDKKAHLTFVSALDYVDIENKYKGVFRPEFTITFDNKKQVNLCMYVAKNSPAATVKDTRGFAWGGAYTDQARFILHENGIDEPLSKFYKKLVFNDGVPVGKLIKAVADGEIGAFAAADGQVKMSSSIEVDGKPKPPLQIIKSVHCTPYENNWVFGYRQDIPPELSSRITGITVNSFKDKRFQQFFFMFTAIKGHFVPFSNNDFARTREISKLRKQLGWDKERREFLKKAK
jgi:hypothetical protein